jgi:hypothetical protein
VENCAVETLSISGEIQSFNFFQRVESVECVPFSPYCSAMIRCSPPVCKYFCVDCMVRFPRGCRDRSLSRKLSGKVRSFNEKASNHFWLPVFSGLGYRWGCLLAPRGPPFLHSSMQDSRLRLFYSDNLRLMVQHFLILLFAHVF